MLKNVSPEQKLLFSSPPPQINKKSLVDETKSAVLDTLKKDPEHPYDFITLKYATDLNERLYKKVKDLQTASRYSVSAPIQYIVFNTSQKSERQSDSTHQLNLVETLFWPAKATIVSAHVHHSAAGSSSVRMYSYSPNTTRVEVVTSDTVPYSAKKLDIQIPPETRVWFSLVTSNAIPSATVILGVVFHPIDFATSTVSE